MSEKPRILIQLDSDPHPSVFDGVVAVDAGVDFLFRHGGVRPEDVRNLVYGAIFTRGPEDLRRTAVYVGGSDADVGQQLFAEVRKTFFGPMRVSVMFDANGANTTAAAAVLSLEKHLDLRGVEVLSLGATGPVGRRVARLLARRGARVRVSALRQDLAEAVCKEIQGRQPDAVVTPWVTATAEQTFQAAEGAAAIIASGPIGVQLLSTRIRQALPELKAAIDLNAVKPHGIEGIDPMDRATVRDGVTCYGAIGVGGLKMKIHKAAIRRLFESNDQALDAEEIYDIGNRI